MQRIIRASEEYRAKAAAIKAFAEETLAPDIREDLCLLVDGYEDLAVYSSEADESETDQAAAYRDHAAELSALADCETDGAPCARLRAVVRRYDELATD